MDFDDEYGYCEDDRDASYESTRIENTILRNI